MSSKAVVLKPSGGAVKGNISYALLVNFLLFVSIIFYNLVSPEKISDYDSYLITIDRVYYFFDWNNIYFEPASTLLLYAARALSSSTENSVTLARCFTTAFLLFFIAFFAAKRNVSSITLIAVLAIYGPLLAYVTIRATPAYLLIALAALDSNVGRKRCFFWVVLAMQFHVSVALAIPIIIINFIQNRTSIFGFIERSTKGILIFITVAAFGLFFAGDSLDQLLYRAVSQIDFLLKYITYVEPLTGDATTTAEVASESAVYHQIYLGFCTLAFFAFLFSKNEQCVRFRSCVILGYIIFIFMQFSPVTAFRYSIFWMVPGLLLFPWDKYIRNSIMTFVAAIGGCVIFLFQLSSILE